MSPAAPRAALWDMDGTLVDSGQLHFLTWRDVLAELGHALTRAEFDGTFGQRNDIILHRLVDPDMTAAEIARIGDHKEALYRARISGAGVALLPGARTWLERLRGDGWRQAIASSAPRANATAILDALGLHDFFDAIAAAEDVTHGKPHPEVFLHAAAQLAVAPRRCVVLEDAPPGLEAGRRAGMPTIGVRSTHAALDADVVVDSLADLPADIFDVLLARPDD